MTLIYNKGDPNKGGEKMGNKKRGRPTDNPKIYRIAVKMDSETKSILDTYCEQEKVNKMEAARRGIRKLKEDIKE